MCDRPGERLIGGLVRTLTGRLVSRLAGWRVAPVVIPAVVTIATIVPVIIPTVILIIIVIPVIAIVPIITVTVIHRSVHRPGIVEGLNTGGSKARAAGVGLVARVVLGGWVDPGTVDR